MNKAILTGRITKDPEMKTTQSGINTCSFTVAVQRKFKNAEGNYDADFINCVSWRAQAEFVSKYFKKGSPIEVCGSIQTRNYKDKDGKTVYVTEINVEEVGFGGKAEKTEKTDEQKAVDLFGDELKQVKLEDGELPF